MADHKNQHYIPQWYQRRFIPDKKGVYWRLDLKPERVIYPNGKEEVKDISLKSIDDCFAEDFFYTNLLFKDPKFLETVFYGRIEDKGAKSIQTLFSPFGENSGERFLDFLDFMDTLRLRTPKGIELVKKHRFLHQARRIELRDIILDNIRRIIGMHQTMWVEGVWFYLSADKSDTKFIVSDHPITLFNKKISPNGESLDMFMLLGTILIFPLDLNNCLIIFHRDYGRNRELNPLKRRINARVYNGNPVIVPEKLKNYDGPMHAQTKELKESEVLAINHLIKERAHKFIASYNKEDLFPEKLIKEDDISNIENILLPKANMVAEMGNSYYGTTTGKCFGVDPYGRPLDPTESERDFKEMQDEVKSIMKNRK